LVVLSASISLPSLSFSCCNISKSLSSELVSSGWPFSETIGSKSVEIEDIYIRLDKELEDLFKTLDIEVGKGMYTVFLTADHGVAENSGYLNSLKIPAGYIDHNKLELDLKKLLFSQFGDSLISSYSNQQIYFNNQIIESKKLNRETIESECKKFLLKTDGISEVYFSSDLQSQSYAAGSYKGILQNGYNFKRCGEIMVRYEPAWMEAYKTGTTHGAEFSYDTHVPLLFYGNGINKGSSVTSVNITDIAPTICMLLNISFPNGCTGKPIVDVLKK
jgi:predicted AlkP superfamily pyrophosphatase or phosphodiesterase